MNTSFLCPLYIWNRNYALLRNLACCSAAIPYDTRMSHLGNVELTWEEQRMTRCDQIDTDLRKYTRRNPRTVQYMQLIAARDTRYRNKIPDPPGEAELVSLAATKYLAERRRWVAAGGAGIHPSQLPACFWED